LLAVSVADAEFFFTNSIIYANHSLIQKNFNNLFVLFYQKFEISKRNQLGNSDSIHFFQVFSKVIISISIKSA